MTKGQVRCNAQHLTILDSHAVTLLRPQPAYQHGTGAAPRPWSKYSEGTSAHERAQPKEEAPAKKSVREEKKKRKLRHGGDSAGVHPWSTHTVCCACSQMPCRMSCLSSAARSQSEPQSYRHAPSALSQCNWRESPHVAVRDGRSADAEDDPKLREFLEVMQPRVKGALWSNDTAGAVKTAAGAGAGQQGLVSSKRKRKQDVVEDVEDDEDGDEEDDALYQELPLKAAPGIEDGEQPKTPSIKPIE